MAKQKKSETLRFASRMYILWKGVVMLFSLREQLMLFDSNFIFTLKTFEA